MCWLIDGGLSDALGPNTAKWEEGWTTRACTHLLGDLLWDGLARLVVARKLAEDPVVQVWYGVVIYKAMRKAYVVEYERPDKQGGCIISYLKRRKINTHTQNAPVVPGKVLEQVRGRLHKVHRRAGACIFFGGGGLYIYIICVWTWMHT